MFVNYRAEWCRRHGTEPPPDLREKYLNSPTQVTVQLSRRNTQVAFAREMTLTFSPSQGKSTAKTPSPKRGSPNPPKADPPRDVMISYSHSDMELMQKLRENLESSGFTVWVDKVGLGPGVNFLSTIGQAIIDAKLFISMVSRSSIKSKFCQDELALAYVSAKPIFPIALEDRSSLFSLMGTDARLQLAGFRWTPFHEPFTFKESFETLLPLLKEKLRAIQDGKKDFVPHGGQGRPASSIGTRHKFYPSLPVSTESNLQDVNPKLSEPPEKFWSENFGEVSQVNWETFWAAVMETFQTEMSEMYEDERIPWLVDILKREMNVCDDVLSIENFFEFCSEDGIMCPFWERMVEQAKESVAMEAVFNMDSHVRVEAIENLAKFNSPAVVDALQDLLVDKRADVRAVAAICMARVGKDDEKTVKLLRNSLKDHDRLVREAGCIALGKLKIKSTLKDLVHIWRNDVIADVRASAELALKQIGGPEVEKEMKVTNVLSKEIRMLTRNL